MTPETPEQKRRRDIQRIFNEACRPPASPLHSESRHPSQSQGAAELERKFDRMWSGRE